MGKKLNLKWVSDAIGEEYKKWKAEDVVLLNAQTGTGKTWFIKNVLMKHALEKKKNILYICNRIYLKRQVKIDLAKMQGIDISDFDLEKIDKLERIGNITILSYQKIQEYVLNIRYELDLGNKEYFLFDYIVLDECHYFLQDAPFNSKTIFFYENFLINYKRAVTILMSATMDYVEDIFKKSYKNREIYEYTTNVDYSFINTFYFKDYENIINTINNDSSGNKWVLFLNNTNKAIELLGKIKDSKFVCAESNSNNDKIDKEELQNIMKNQKFGCKCLIATKVLDNGINLVDDNLRNIVIIAWDKIDFIQMIGRKRVDINNASDINLYIMQRYKKSFKAQINFNIMPKRASIDLYFKYPRKFNREYDINLEKLAELKGLFYKDIYTNNQFVINNLGYEMFKKQEQFFEYMIDSFKLLGENTFIFEQLSWINAEYNEANWIENVIDNEEVETLGDYLGKMFNEKIVLLKADDRMELIEKINLIDGHNSNIKENKIQYIKNINTLNEYLKDLKISYMIKEFQTSRIIDGNKKKFKNCWKIIKMVG